MALLVWFYELSWAYSFRIRISFPGCTLRLCKERLQMQLLGIQTSRLASTTDQRLTLLEWRSEAPIHKLHLDPLRHST